MDIEWLNEKMDLELLNKQMNLAFLNEITDVEWLNKIMKVECSNKKIKNINILKETTKLCTFKNCFNFARYGLKNQLK